MTPIVELVELLEWYAELSDELVARSAQGDASDEEGARLALRLKTLAASVASHVEPLVEQIPELSIIRDHSKAVVLLLDRALEMYPVLDDRAAVMAGEHAAYLVAGAKALREILPPA